MARLDRQRDGPRIIDRWQSSDARIQKILKRIEWGHLATYDGKKHWASYARCGHVIRDIVWSKYKMDFDAVQSRLEPRSFETRRTLTIDCPTRQPKLQLRLHETGRLAIASHCRRTKDSSPAAPIESHFEQSARAAAMTVCPHTQVQVSLSAYRERASRVRCGSNTLSVCSTE